MPLPLVTCLLVLGAVVGTANVAAGVIIIGVATLIQFFLPTYSNEQTGAPPGTPDPDTFSI